MTGQTRNGTGPRNGFKANAAGRERKPPQVIKTWAFDSVGPRKYALQIRRAANGNPCLKIVEGVPQPDGTFRRFELTFWSEDFPRLFQTLEEVRAYMQANNIRTPDGHKYDPRPRNPGGRRNARALARAARQPAPATAA